MGHCLNNNGQEETEVLADKMSQRQLFHRICHVDTRLGSAAMNSVRMTLNEESE